MRHAGSPQTSRRLRRDPAYTVEVAGFGEHAGGRTAPDQALSSSRFISWLASFGFALPPLAFIT